MFFFGVCEGTSRLPAGHSATSLPGASPRDRALRAYRACLRGAAQCPQPVRAALGDAVRVAFRAGRALLPSADTEAALRDAEEVARLLADVARLPPATLALLRRNPDAGRASAHHEDGSARAAGARRAPDEEFDAEEDEFGGRAPPPPADPDAAWTRA